MRHNELDREFPCAGELIGTAQSTQMLTIAVCLGCGTEYKYVPDSTWVEIISGDEAITGLGNVSSPRGPLNYFTPPLRFR